MVSEQTKAAARDLLRQDHIDAKGVADVEAGRKTINEAQRETGLRKNRGESPVRSGQGDYKRTPPQRDLGFSNRRPGRFAGLRRRLFG